MWEYNINVIGMVIAAAVVLFNIVLLKKLIGKFGGKAGKELWFAVTLVCAAGACYLIPYFAAGRIFAIREMLAGALLFLFWDILVEKVGMPEDTPEKPDSKRQLPVAVIPLAEVLILACLFWGDLRPYSLAAVCCACILATDLSVFYLHGILVQNVTHLRQRDIYRQQTDHYRNQLDIIAEALAYLKSMEEELLNPGEHAKTGNREIDSLLNYKLERAEELLTETEYRINVPAKLPVKSFDINVILGNLLDNAIEAAQGSERKWMKFVMRADRGILLIHVANSFGEELRRNGKRFLSTKKDSGEHGVGLQNVRRMVERLHGEIEFQQKEELFSVDVMLYMNEM